MISFSQSTGLIKISHFRGVAYEQQTMGLLGALLALKRSSEARKLFLTPSSRNGYTFCLQSVFPVKRHFSMKVLLLKELLFSFDERVEPWIVVTYRRS